MELKTISSQRHLLAEGPFWCAQSGCLYWVDIPAQEVWCWHSKTGQYEHWQMPEKVSAVFTTNRSDTLLVVLASRVALFNTSSQELITFCVLDEDRPQNRGNDAKVAPDGSLWVGTMDDNEEQVSGRLWRITAEGKKQLMLDNVGIANTFAWASYQDGARQCMYFADSMQGQIHCYPYPDFQDIRDQAAFVTTPDNTGPDGSTLDNQGYLWNAQWDGQRIVRYAPDGSIDRILELPFARPTSCTFGGPDSSTLYITSASVGLSDDQLAEQPLAGYVVALETDVAGPASQAFWLDR